MKKRVKFQKPDQDEGDLMLPFMSLLLIIIPVLITNVAFYHFKALSVNIPGLSKSEEKPEEAVKPDKEKSYVLQLTISEASLDLELIDEDSGESLQKETAANNESAAETIWRKVIEFRTAHKKLNSMLVSVEPNVTYERMVKILEQCKKPDSAALITEELLLVLMPKGDEENNELEKS
ncbi:MAG: hypothetical protein A2504_17630 [Bdellovibrionales bacterium RIFOXYD12_FULL_39_22]|nr:MAG: hypothetical protein A2385_15330 [Bdellovibrionales bacterium RIFOXYB1_FULL_39_21]OFZ40619.1 MAG: hypothetical protein A2485_03435 [Bdellovibrionales bacterium RIFOXYC12_FULL_39_17]OFZ50433.1 MAG: hypothetical protein A2404_02630 [Bdellovibrionales bacterium RIFOXYC1_FULL_39_130]OFZ75284.1 MAG: hypothetical protein A2451_12870 [Bdellovibrionales bacterium RIFOXYC2_FULL_39_8]OFZ77692.1 MAG: hypothetical protein A2560_05000 [Bdellovibrionales bacterium RIFOXYD1_FULL_39_84]OFZ91726.1 MAG: